MSKTSSGDSKTTTHKSYKDLKVWQKGIELSQKIYQEVSSYPANTQGLIGNILINTSVAIPALIANGQASRSKNDYVAGLKGALGKLSELEALLLMKEGDDHSIEIYSDSLLELRLMLAKLTSSITKPKIIEESEESQA